MGNIGPVPVPSYSLRFAARSLEGRGKAIAVRDELLKWEDMDFITFSELTSKKRNEAAQLAVRFGLRGTNAIMVQTAKEMNRALITFDEEIAEKAKPMVEVYAHKDLSSS